MLATPPALAVKPSDDCLEVGAPATSSRVPPKSELGAPMEETTRHSACVSLELPQQCVQSGNNQSPPRRKLRRGTVWTAHLRSCECLIPGLLWLESSPSVSEAEITSN